MEKKLFQLHTHTQSRQKCDIDTRYPLCERSFIHSQSLNRQNVNFRRIFDLNFRPAEDPLPAKHFSSLSSLASISKNSGEKLPRSRGSDTHLRRNDKTSLSPNFQVRFLPKHPSQQPVPEIFNRITASMDVLDKIAPFVNACRARFFYRETGERDLKRFPLPFPHPVPGNCLRAMETFRDIRDLLPR